jgi:hypothetical protein
MTTACARVERGSTGVLVMQGNLIAGVDAGRPLPDFIQASYRAVFKYVSVIAGENHTFHRGASGPGLTSLRLVNPSPKEVINKTQHAPVCHGRRVETDAKCTMKRGLQKTSNTVRCGCDQRQNAVTEKTLESRHETPSSQRGSLAPQHISRVAECRLGVGAEDSLPGFIYTVIRCCPWHMRMIIEIRLLSHCGSTSMNVCSIAPHSVKCAQRLFIIRPWQYGDG